MPVIYTATINGNDYGFDFADQRIDIDVAVTSVVVGDLWDAIQDAQASVAGMAYDQIASAEGLTTLSTGIATFITLSLLNSWEINTLLSSGKFEVSGGNLVRADNDDPFRDNPLITYINNLSQAGVVAAAESSGLTAAQSAQLASISSDTNELQTDWADGGRLDTILNGRSTFDPSSSTIESTLTYDDAFRLILSESSGKVTVTNSGTTVTFRDYADSKDRITATVDTDGQRTSVTVDGT